MELDYKILGKRIKTEREKRGWTQAKLASESGISDSHISSIERGHSDFSVRYLVKIVNAFEISVDELLSDEIYSSDISCKIINDIIEDCESWEIKILADCLIALKGSLKKYEVNPAES